MNERNNFEIDGLNCKVVLTDKNNGRVKAAHEGEGIVFCLMKQEEEGNNNNRPGSYKLEGVSGACGTFSKMSLRDSLERILYTVGESIEDDDQLRAAVEIMKTIMKVVSEPPDYVERKISDMPLI